MARKLATLASFLASVARIRAALASFLSTPARKLATLVPNLATLAGFLAALDSFLATPPIRGAPAITPRLIVLKTSVR